MMIGSMPDVNDERVAIVADSIQGSSCADVACVASEAAKHGFDDARALQTSSHRHPQETAYHSEHHQRLKRSALQTALHKAPQVRHEDCLL